MGRKKKGKKKAAAKQDADDIPFLRANKARSGPSFPTLPGHEDMPGLGAPPETDEGGPVDPAEMEAAKEEWIQNYAAYLDEVKKSDPAARAGPRPLGCPVGCPVRCSSPQLRPCCPRAIARPTRRS